MNISALTEARALKIHVCNDCGSYVNTYMVKNEIWDKAWPDWRAIRAVLATKHNDTKQKNTICLNLCLPCLSHRLGRKLNINDFDWSIPINRINSDEIYPHVNPL